MVVLLTATPGVELTTQFAKSKSAKNRPSLQIRS